MPYREKVAWLTLVAFVVTYLPYFVLTSLDPPLSGVLPNLQQLIRLGVAAAAQMLILGLGHLVLRLRSRQDAREPADERDQTIDRRSTRTAYRLLIAGMIVVGVVMPFTKGGWEIVNAALFAIVIVEVVHHGIAVWSYRRGWQ